MKKICIKAIKIYQSALSVLLYRSMIFLGMPAHSCGCRYYPTCSGYAIQSIEEFGVIKGIIKSFWRILRCNPFSHGGYDPVMIKKEI